MPIKISSRKSKGREFQKWIIKKLIEILGIDPEDIENRSMGSAGEDVIMSKAARDLFPFSIEAKAQQRVNVWNSMEQARSNAKGYEPIVFIKRNRHKPLVLLDAEYFIKMNKKEE